MKQIIGISLGSLISFCTLADSDSSELSSRADYHAPIGVMGDHTHKQGEWMFSYRYMMMQMDEILLGGNDVTPQQVVSPTGSNFMVSPVEMSMAMHMLGVMYAPTNELTVMLMANFLEQEMDHITRPGGAFTSESDGVGDTKLNFLYQLSKRPEASLVANFSLSIPTGSIDEEGITPASGGVPVQLPYPMQLGSGTYDATVGFTFTQFEKDWSFGSQALYTHRFSDNDNNYTLGNSFSLSPWISKIMSQRISVSGRLHYTHWDDIDGADPLLNPMLVPTADSRLHNGENADVLLGVNWFPVTRIKSHRLLMEASYPVYQHLNGPQLATAWTFTLGWQYSL